MNFDVRILGSASALPTSRRYPSAHVLSAHGRFYLIDCGEGTQIQLRKYAVSFGKINQIFISHLHGDHVFGLFGLLSSFNLLGRKNDLHIFGHSDLQKLISFFLDNFCENLQFKIVHHKIEQRTFHKIFEDKKLEVYAIPLKHRVPCFGYLFQEKDWQPNIRKEAVAKYSLGIKDIQQIKAGEPYYNKSGELIQMESLAEPPYKSRKYAYVSDSAYYERIVPYLKEVDLLFHEATFALSEKKIAKQTGHSTASQAAMIAKKADAKKLVLGHFSSRYKDLTLLQKEACEIFPNTILAEEGLELKVPLERGNHRD